MNTEAADLRTVPVSARTTGPRETLLMLMRREFWEHAALWRVPAVVAGLLAVATIFPGHINVNMDDARMAQLDNGGRIMVLNMSQMLVASLIYVAAAFVVSFYALDCLYAERKDRSILFWKSLPVSDGMTVLSKFLVAMVVVPLGVFVLASAAHLIALMIWEARASLRGLPDFVRWDSVAWLRGEAVIFLCMLLGVLWYAPVVAASMLLSAWLKRSPVLWAFLGPVLAFIAEGVIFRSRHLLEFVKWRMGGIWQLLASRDGEYVVRENGRLLSDLNWAAAFTSLDLWLGVAATAALLYAAARIRRYRDDT